MGSDGRFERLLVIGAGRSGQGVAAIALGHGIPVVLVDRDEQALEPAYAAIRAELDEVRQADDPSTEALVSHLSLSSDIKDGFGAAAVVEAVTEKAVAKTRALLSACKVVAPGTPLISTASAIPIDELADWSGRPQDVVRVQFVFPVRGRMVEMSYGRRTCDHTVAAVRDLLAALGREVVVVGDAPGFVTGRMLHALINSAARIVAQRTATAEDVDTLSRGCFGHEAGPLQIADAIGIDSLVDSLTAIYERTGDPSYLPCDLLLEKIRAGSLGRKSGRGFYEYDAPE